MSVRQSSAIAGVTYTTLKRGMQADDEFRARMAQARANVLQGAAAVVVSSIKSRDEQLRLRAAQWLLERRDPERWGTRSARPAAAADQGAVNPAADPNAYAKAVDVFMQFAAQRDQGPTGRFEDPAPAAAASAIAKAAEEQLQAEQHAAQTEMGDLERDPKQKLEGA